MSIKTAVTVIPVNSTTPLSQDELNAISARHAQDEAILKAYKASQAQKDLYTVKPYVDKKGKAGKAFVIGASFGVGLKKAEHILALINNPVGIEALKTAIKSGALNS